MNSAIPYNKQLMEHLGLNEGSINNRMMQSSKPASQKKKGRPKKNQTQLPKSGKYLNRSIDTNKG